MHFNGFPQSGKVFDHCSFQFVFCPLLSPSFLLGFLLRICWRTYMFLEFCSFFYSFIFLSVPQTGWSQLNSDSLIPSFASSNLLLDTSTEHLYWIFHSHDHTFQCQNFFVLFKKQFLSLMILSLWWHIVLSPFSLQLCLSLHVLLVQILLVRQRWKPREFRSPLGMDTALHLCVAFHIFRNMLKLFKTFYGHLIPHLSLLNFLVSGFSVPAAKAISGSWDVKQRLLIIFNKCT